MNYALIGPGAMGEEHAIAFAKLDNVKPYVVAGPNPEATRTFARTHGFESWSEDLVGAMTDPDVDIVVISSPNAVHAAQASVAIGAGKHVLIEIPVAMSMSDAEHLAGLAGSSDSVVMAGHISRYYSALRRLGGQVARGELHVRHLICSMGTDKRLNRNWKGQDRDWVDDLLWHHGMHVFDALLQFFPGGGPEVVNVVSGARHPQHGGVMDLSVALRFTGGSLATVALTYHANEQFTRYTVVAEEGFFDLAQDAPGGARSDLTEGQPFSDLVLAQNRDFVSACLSGGPAPISIDDVLPAMRLVDAINVQVTRELRLQLHGA